MKKNFKTHFMKKNFKTHFMKKNIKTRFKKKYLDEKIIPTYIGYMKENIIKSDLKKKKENLEKLEKEEKKYDFIKNNYNIEKYILQFYNFNSDYFAKIPCESYKNIFESFKNISENIKKTKFIELLFINKNDLLKNIYEKIDFENIAKRIKKEEEFLKIKENFSSSKSTGISKIRDISFSDFCSIDILFLEYALSTNLNNFERDVYFDCTKFNCFTT